MGISLAGILAVSGGILTISGVADVASAFFSDAGTEVIDAGVVIVLDTVTIVAAPQPVALPADFNDLGDTARVVFNAVENKQWGLVASLVVLLIISLSRKFASETSGFGKWVRSKMGAIVFNFALSFGGSFATMFAAGQTFTWPMVLKALSISLTASGGWSLWKNFNEAREEKKAQAKGLEAAKNPDETINK